MAEVQLSEEPVEEEELAENPLAMPDPTPLPPGFMSRDQNISYNLDTEEPIYDQRQTSLLANTAALATPEASDEKAMAQIYETSYAQVQMGQEEYLRDRLYTDELIESELAASTMLQTALASKNIDEARTLGSLIQEGTFGMDPETQMEQAAVEKIQAISAVDPDYADLVAFNADNPTTTPQIAADQAKRNLIIHNQLKKLATRREETGLLNATLNVLAFLVPLNGTTAETGWNPFGAGSHLLAMNRRIFEARTEDLEGIVEELDREIMNETGIFSRNALMADLVFQDMLQTNEDNYIAKNWLNSLLLPFDAVDAAGLIRLGGAAFKLNRSVGAGKAVLEVAANKEVAAKAYVDEIATPTLPGAIEPDEVTVKAVIPTQLHTSFTTGLSAAVLRALDEVRNAMDTATKEVITAPRLEELSPESLSEISKRVYDKNHIDNGVAGFTTYYDTTSKTYKNTILHGKQTSGNAYLSEASAKGAATKRGFEEGMYKIVPEENGKGFYIETTTQADEFGIVRHISKNASDAAIGNGFLRKVLSKASIVPKEFIDRATTTKANKGKLRAAQRQASSVYDQLSIEEADGLVSIINKGKRTLNPEGGYGIWYKPHQLDEAYLAKHKRLPNDLERLAYYTYKEQNDQIYEVMNANERVKAAAEGMNTHHFKTDEGAVSYVGKEVEYDAGKMNKNTRIHNMEDNVTYLHTDETIKAAVESGEYRLVKLHSPIDTPKSSANYVLARASRSSQSDLKQYIIPYAGGGTRNYQGRWFVKQASFKSTPDGQLVASNPLTHSVNVGVDGAESMAKDLNTARDIYKRYDKLRKSRTASSSQKFDALKAANERLESLGLRFASIREMDELYQAGRLSKEDAIVRFDREPMPVSGNEDVARLEETPMYQTGNGQLYYSERGDFLPGDDRGFADLLDPFTTLSRQQDHISSQAATSSYVAHEVPRWIARFGKYMEVKGVEDPGILDLFRHGTWKKATPDEIQAEGEAFREFHNMTMGTPTESSAALARWNEKMAKKIERYMNTSRKFKDSERAQEAGRWMTDKLIDGKDPVGILKGWTYDMTLGAFNFGQLILQGSAFAAVVSISPKYGALAFKDWFHLRAAAFNPNAVEPMGKAWALMTGGSVDEFKLMVDDLRRSGLMDVAATDTLLERASSLEGGTGAAGLVNRLRQAGRVPVYEGERINRITAFGVARREALDKVNDGTLEAGSDAYHTYIQGRTSALTMNMISGSEAWWQGNKFTSLGTQFWAYPARVVESMLNVATVGKLGNRTLSTRENFQFLLGQGMMWGTAGVPLATSVYNWVTEGLGTQLDEDTHRTITTGFIDRALHEMSGGRINSAIGKNLGAGPFLADLIDTIMEGDALGLVGGVSAVKIRTGLGSFMNTIAMLNEAENVGGADYSIELMKEMGRLFKGVNNATRAYAVAKYGLLLDSRGQNVIGEEDPMNAFIVFTGFPLAQQAQLYDYTGRSSKNYKSTVDGLGKLLAAQRLEYYLWSLERDRDPKKGDWIMNKQKAIADLIDNPKMLDDVRDKAKNTLEGNGWRALFKNQGKLNYIPEGEQ